MNSSRGNNYYDLSDPSAGGYNRFTNTAAGLVWSRTTDTWEPPDSVKGDIARALFYMVVRYTGDVDNEPLLALTDRTNEIVSGANLMGRYTTLLKWHLADPVSRTEQARNEGVYGYQANRNPFVDHPEWVLTAFVPRVRVTRVDTNIWLSWSNDYAPSLAFEQSMNLGSAWLAVTNSPTLTSTNTWTLRFPIEPGSRFIRVRLE